MQRALHRWASWALGVPASLNEGPAGSLRAAHWAWGTREKVESYTAITFSGEGGDLAGLSLPSGLFPGLATHYPSHHKTAAPSPDEVWGEHAKRKTQSSQKESTPQAHTPPPRPAGSHAAACVVRGNLPQLECSRRPSNLQSLFHMNSCRVRQFNRKKQSQNRI